MSAQGPAPARTTGHWVFDHADWQKWEGAIPAGGMPVPTLAEQGHVGPVVQASGYFVLLSDGSVRGYGPAQGWDLPAGSAVAVSGKGDYQGYAGLILTPAGKVMVLDSSGLHAPAHLDPADTFVAINSNRGETYGTALRSDGAVIKLSDGTVADTEVVCIVGTVYHGTWMKADGTLGGDGAMPGTYTRLWGGYGAVVAEKADGTLATKGGMGNAGTDFTGLPATGAHVLSVALPGGWDGKISGAWVDDAHVTHLFGNLQSRLRDPGPFGVAVGSSHYLNVLPRRGVSFLVRSDGHLISLESGVDAALEPKKLQPASFDHHTIVRDAANLADAKIDFASLMGSTDSALPWEIDWGDGTARTVVPVGTAAQAIFQHTYADNADYTVTIKVPGTDLIVDTVIAHYQPPAQQWVFVWDPVGAKFDPATPAVYATADGQFHDAELNVYDPATTTWVK